MTIPNFITVARLLAVPVIVYAMLLGAFDMAFLLFLLAGISDGIDGFIARRYPAQRSELGAYLDPIADKLMLVSVYLMFAFVGELPLWLVVMVVSRDILIVVAVIISSVMARPVKMRPILVSKANTAMQIVLATFVLAQLSYGNPPGLLRELGVGLVAVLTVLSAAAYLRDWLRHMSTIYDEK